MANVGPAPDPRPAPPDLEVLRAFVNSDNRYHGVDLLRHDERDAWCAEAWPQHPVDDVPPAGWRRLIDLRDRVRAVLAGEEGAASAFTAAATRYPLLVDLDEPSGLRSADDRQEARLAGAVLAALHVAARDGRLARLRLCQRPDCGWCYYDTSRNHSARWCSAEPCGDVMKTRAYRSRHRSDREEPA